MSITIKDLQGKTILHLVAKTSRGFNRAQRQEIAIVRAMLKANPNWIPLSQRLRG
jgi:hypothetical protein